MKSWYTIKNKANTDTASISIHDEIGLWGITAAQFMKDVKDLGDVKAIHLSIHSPGGNVFDGLAMYNTLAAHPAKIYGKVAGIAASAASFVLMAADQIEMPEDSFLMIHNTQGGAYGDSEYLREMADLMDKLGSQIANIYKKRTGQDSATIADMMSAETWMTANEAKELGFADTVSNAIGLAAKATNFDKYFKALPFDAANALPAIENERDLEKALREAGYSRTKATESVANLKATLKATWQRDAGNDADTQALNEVSAILARLKLPEPLT
jgi:ATP-dependent Clp endopeptidase proteolytic subunit ClpP